MYLPHYFYSMMLLDNAKIGMQLVSPNASINNGPSIARMEQRDVLGMSIGNIPQKMEILGEG